MMLNLVKIKCGEMTDKYLGPGVTHSQHTKMYTAKLGVKTIGEYRTLEDAAKAYNDNAKRIFNFPILNKNHVGIEPEIVKVVELPKKKIDPPGEPVVLNEFYDNTMDNDSELMTALRILNEM